MTRTYASAIAFSFATLFAGQAMAANSNTALTREQVKAELAEAIQTGNVVTGESSARLNEQFPQVFGQQQASSVTRSQVQAELAQAIQAGNVVVGESSVRVNEAFPHNYATQSNVASKSRDEVRAELAEAASTGQLYRNIEA